jgi:hypothetical protein
MKPATLIDLCIRGDDLQLNWITGRLGTHPTSGFNPNEPYLGKRKVGDEIRTVEVRRPFGVWHFSTEGLVASPLLQDHADFLLATLNPCEGAIGELIQAGYHVRLYVWYVGPTGFDMSSATIARLASFCQDMTFKWFEASEDEDKEKGA